MRWGTGPSDNPQGRPSLFVYVGESEHEYRSPPHIRIEISAADLHQILAASAGPQINAHEISAEKVHVIRTWYNNCLDTHHERCRPDLKSGTPRSLPRRLIQVDETGTAARLCEAKDLEEPIEYATLSHCWGGKVELWTSIPVEETGIIQMSEAPNTLKDAVWLLAALGIPYLWVDALCIDQASLEDWEIESAKMGDIYTFGVINIAATAAVDGSGGLFPPCDRLVACPLLFKTKEGQMARFVAHNHAIRQRGWLEEVDLEKINTRAWVFQERFLSPRTIHFGKAQTYMECYTSCDSDTIPGMYLSRPFKRSIGMINAQFAWGTAAEQSLPNIWSTIVSSYAECDLTKATDKLVALAGIANRVANAFGFDDDSYINGLWRPNLLLDLCWRPSNASGNSNHKDRAPSWTWARLDGPVSIWRPPTAPTFCARINGVAVAHKGTPFMGARQGTITLQGPLCSIVPGIEPFELSKTSGVPNDGSYPLKLFYMSIGWDQGPRVFYDYLGRKMAEGERLYILLIEHHEISGGRREGSGIVLRHTGLKRGQYERYGVWPENYLNDGHTVNTMLDVGRDVKRVPRDDYIRFDPDWGFEIELV